MSDDTVEQAIEALAQRGSWVSVPRPDAELLRVEIRRAARARGIRVRTGIGAQDYLWACTPDGLPAEEPWRGAVEHAHDSGVMDDVLRDSWERMWNKGQDDS